ncbi:MAG: Fic family protein [Wenzhouxiangellaceae bacterium]
MRHPASTPQPFNDLPLLTPSAELQAPQLIALCDEVEHRLRSLDQLIQAQDSSSTLIAGLLLPEAQRNACGISQLPLEQLLYDLGPAAEPSDPGLSAIRYHQALCEGLHLIRKRTLCTATAIQINHILTRGEPWVRFHPGPPLTHDSDRSQIFYVPPDGEDRLRSKLGNWEVFMHDYPEIHPLIRMAVGHAQFIAISPFTSGNVRCAHILSQLYLLDKGMLSMPALLLSVPLLTRRDLYERHFIGAIHHQLWQPWIHWLLEQLLNSIRISTQLLHDIGQLWNEYEARCRSLLPASLHPALLEQLFETPDCTSELLLDNLIDNPRLVMKCLDTLCHHDLLRQHEYDRQTLYRNWRLVEMIHRASSP